MRYGSVCSGIEAATVAWHPLDWRPVFFAEIDAFPSAVLAHHYPEVPNLGDFTTITRERCADDIDLLVGGTPCQSFSVAGLRRGLDDERGNLALEYLRLAQRLRPRWLVWENVPGVLSSGGGRDFGSILGGMVELGYGVAYRVLDAQFIRVDGYARAVPQRRRRVFVVGCLGDWRGAAAVLSERESLRGDPAPRREAGQGTAPTLAARTRGGGGLGTDFDCDGGLIADTLRSHTRPGSNSLGGAVAHALTAARGRACAHGPTIETYVPVAHTLNAHGGAGRIDAESETFVAHALRAEGFDASEDGTGRGIPIVPFDTTQITGSENRSNPQPGDPCHTLSKGAHPPAIAFSSKNAGNDAMNDCAPTMRANAGGQLAVAQGWRVRRLMPLECERLQGFPDGWTDVPYRGKRAADGPRYKALGNSMAIPPMRWIGMRIALVDRLLSKQEAA